MATWENVVERCFSVLIERFCTRVLEKDVAKALEVKQGAKQTKRKTKTKTKDEIEKRETRDRNQRRKRSSSQRFEKVEEEEDEDRKEN